MFWFIILLLIVGGGFYFYQKMMVIEREIRAEQDAEKSNICETVENDNHSEDTDPHGTVFDTENELSAGTSEKEEMTSLEKSLLLEVSKQPGLKQTDLYLLFADTNKKQMQQVLKGLADRKILKREKRGSSFLLYPE